jgi:rhodanese-related sulfurtransferase
MKRRGKALVVAVLGLSLLVMLSESAMTQEVPRISKEELKGMLGNPDLLIVDVRKGTDWKASEFKIKGAVREDPKQVSSWMDKYPQDKTLIIYCA